MLLSLSLLIYISSILSPLLLVAFLVLIERKVLGMLQNRMSPNINSFYSILQTVMDSVKLLTKKISMNYMSMYSIFMSSPVMLFIVSIIMWMMMSDMFKMMKVSFVFLLLFYMSVLLLIPMMSVSWVTTNLYSFISTVRSTAQMMSYDIVLLFVMFLYMNSSVMFSNNLNTQYSNKFSILMLVQTSLLYLSTLSESNRTPFDLIESESELVSSFNLEYSSLSFTFLFLGEYCILWIMTSLLITLMMFYSTMNINSLLFTLSFVMMSIYIRSTLPRFKYNSLIMLFWSSLVFSVILLLMFHIS